MLDRVHAYKTFLFPIVVLTMIGISCAADDRDWREAATQDNTGAYEQYIQKHHNGKHLSEAQARIDHLQMEEAWRVATKTNTIQVYESFVQRYGQSEYAQEARLKLNALRTPSEQAAMDAIAQVVAVKYPQFFHPQYTTVGVDIRDLGKFDEKLGYLSVVAEVSMYTEGGVGTFVKLGTYRFRLRLTEEGEWMADQERRVD